jgi:hypothetical protein
VFVATSNVCPSGAAFASGPAAIVFEAPGRFSMTNGCFSDSPNFLAEHPRDHVGPASRRGADHDPHWLRRIRLRDALSAVTAARRHRDDGAIAIATDERSKCHCL